MSRRGYSNGYMTIREPGKKLVEIDTATCVHCNSIVPLTKMDGTKADPPGYCLQCHGVICPKCSAHGECTPFMKWVEAQESKDRFARSIGLV